MRIELPILRAVLRITRAGRPATLAAVLVRIDAPRRAVFAALGRLHRHGLISRSGAELRLTMMGLALAMATVPSVVEQPKQSPSRRPTRRAA